MTLRRRGVAVLLSSLTLMSSLCSASQASDIHHQYHRYHRHPVHRLIGQGTGRPFPDAPLGPAYQSNTSGTNNNGYVYNSDGYGRFVPGPDGSFGGYPAGSAGAEELMTQQERKCEAVPEEC